jgi:hypothetical protein
MNEITSIPDGRPLGTDAQRNVGNAITGPNPAPKPKTAQEARNNAVARMNEFMIAAPQADTDRYEKPFAFGSDITGQNFERYYSHPKFKQFGFSPFRDNETVYNQKSSLWDDTIRAAKQYPKLVGLAVSGTYGNWDSFLSGTPDTRNAEKMERYMNIASSTREGFGAKALNFGSNTAYTVGIIGTIVAEEFALAGAAATGVGAPAAAAKTGSNVLKLGKALGRLSDVFSLNKDLSKAKQIWDATGKVSRAVLPFQNTADLFRTAQRAEMGWDKMTDFAKGFKSFGAFYRDLREINLVTSEAKLEGGFVQNEVAKELTAQFRRENGRDPEGDEVKKIYDQARKAGFTTSYANMAGIYASNKVVLDRLLKGIPGAGALEHSASKSVRGSIVKNTDWLKTGKNPYEVLYGLKKFGNKEWLKQGIKNAPKSGLRFMTANLMEGTQEVYQEATAEAMKKYYVDTYNDPSKVHPAFMSEAINHGLKSQFSSQGLETFLSGFLMAGPIQIAGLALTKSGQYANMLNLKRQEKAFANDPKNAGKENPYTKKLNEFKDWDSKVVTALNDLTKNKKDYFSRLYRNTKDQKDLADLYEDSVLNEDTKTAVDTKDDALFSHIKTLRKSGTLNMFKDELKALSQLSDNELADAFNEKPGANPVDNKTVSQRIDSVLQRIDDIDKHLTEVEKITNPYDPKQDFFNWFGFEEARDLVAYNDYSYKRIGDRMVSIEQDIKNAMASVGLDSMYADIAPLFSVGRGGDALIGATDNFGMENEINLLTKEIDSLQGATDPELIKRKDRLSRKKKTLSSLSVAAQNAVVAYKLLNKPNQTQQEQDENSERVAEAEKLLYDAFKGHMQTLSERGAAGASYAMFDKTIDELFEKYKDLWRLDADKTNVANAINMLYNPEVFAQSVNRLSEAAAQTDAIKAEQAKKMAVEFEKRYATNDFLNDLISKFNVFVSEEEAEAYMANDVVPTKFIDADTGYEIDPRKDAKKYNEILDLIDQYDEIFFERTGQRLFKPTREDVGARVAGTIKDTDKEVNQLVPEFQEGDKRTMSDLAAEYGFDKGRVDSEVKVDTVLNAIINNKFATQDQKELARKLITLIDKTEVITFKSNHYVNSTYDTQNGIIVDPRYSSSDYQAKVSVPIEYSILNAVMQKVITDNLSNKEFSDRIAELRVLAVNASNDTEKALFRYALANNQTFLGELLTNGDFQQHLAGLEYTGEQTELTKEATTMWSKFLTILTDLLKNILNFNSSLYREAMAVTLNKLSQPTTGATTTGGTTPGPQGPSGLSPNVVDKTDKELLDKLRAKYDAIIAGMSPEDSSRMNFDSWMQTDSRALEIIRKHKADKVRQQASGTQGGGPIASAAVKKNALTAVGFTIEEINSMSDTEIDDNYNRREELAKGFVPNLNSQDWGEIDVQMQAAKEKAALLKLALNADDTKYVEYDENGKPISGTEKERVSNVVKEPMTDKQPVATARGNIIDGLYKKYLLGEIQSFEEFKKYYAELQKKPKNSYVNFNDAMLEDLFDIVRKVQKDLNAKGIKVIPDFPIIAGKLGNKDVAGEMDILAYNKAGKVFIIDIKSSYANRRIGYDVYNSMRTSLGEKFGDFMEKLKANEYFIKKTIASYTDPAERALIQDKFDEILNRFPVEQKFFNESKTNDVKAPTFYVESDMAQQLAYKELLRQTTGIEADYINIFPVITSTAKAGVISQATLEREITGELMKDGEYVLNEQGLRIPTVGGYSIRVDNSKTVYDLNIPEVTQTVTTYPENPLTKKAPQPPAAPTPVSDIERLSNKILNSPQGTINTGKLEEAVLPNTIIEEPIAQDRDGNWLEVYINNPKLQGTLLARNGNYLFRAMQGRFFVIAKVGNFYLPFYISSAGTSGKNEGEWYPFFGYNNWLVKGSVGKKGEMEYSEKISEVQKLLNDNFRIPAKYFTQFGQITNGKGTPANPDRVFYDINTHVKYESWFVDFDRQKDNKYTEEEFVADRTGLNPKNVVNDGKGSVDSWIKDVVALTEDAEKASKGVISNAELAALEGKQTQPNVVKVYHHTSVAPQDFNFGNFQRGKDQISQFGDGLNASTTTNDFFVKRYGNPIEGEVNDSDFVVIDANKSEKELYEELVAKGYIFNNPATGSYIGNDPAKEYDSNDKANVDPAIMSLFNDFQKSNPDVKGVKVINHIIGNQKVDPFYVIYNAKSFYGPGSLSTQQQSGSSQTRTYDNKPIAKGLKGKVIYITPDSYTTGDMKTHSEDLVVGNELVDEVILGLDQEALKAKLKNLSEGTSKLSKAAGGLLYFLNNVGLSKDTLSGKDNFKYLLAVLESNGENSISAEIYIKALAKARELAEQGKTVVFDNTSILKFSNSLDLVITNAKSDIAEAGKTTPNNKTAIANAEANVQSTNKKRVFTESAETIITAGAKSQTPKKLKDLRALINGINNKQDLAVNELMLSTLDKTGVLDELLADQNITKDQYRALLNDKKQQIGKQLSIKDLVNKGENTLIRFLNKKGEERIGLVVKETFDGKLEIKDVTDEYNSGQGDLFVDVDDLSYGGLGSKSKSLKLAEKDVNEKVLGIMEEKKVEKSDTTTKAQSDSGQTTADQTVNERKQGLEGFDPFNPDDRKDDDNDLFNCNTVGKK